jgi:hypothetical protein
MLHASRMCEERKVRARRWRRRPKPENEREEKPDILPGNLYYTFKKHYTEGI